MADVLGLTIDTQEPRVKTDRLACLVTGSKNNVVQWDMLNSSNVYLDPVTSTAMLLPTPVTSDWDDNATTSDPTSPFFRFGLASTNQASNPNWIEHIPNNTAGNVYLYGLGVNDAISPLGTFEANRAWYFSYYAFGQGETFLQFQAIWGNVTLDVFSDGTVQIFKNGLVVGSGNIGTLDDEDAPTTVVGGGTGGHKANNTGTAISFLVIPCRTREILFLCNKGGAFHVVFDDIPKDELHPVIIPGGAMSYQVVHGQAMVQAAPIWWGTSGYVLSNTQTFRNAPVAGATPSVLAYYGLPNIGVLPGLTPSLVKDDGTTPFVGDGTTKTAKVRVGLSHDGKSSPWLYGASAIFDAVTVNTDSAHSTVLDPYTVEANVSVPESPSGVTMTVHCKDPEAIGALIGGNWQSIGNRPVVAKIGTIAMLTGRTKAPRIQYGPTDDTSRIIWECRDRWKAYDNYEILDPTPFDNRRLQSAIQEVAMYPGYPIADMDVEDFDFTIPSQGQGSTGEWCVIPEAGDTADKWLMKFFEDYARTAIVGWYPSATGPKFRFRTPTSIGTTPSATIYVRKADAITAGYTEANHWKHVLYDGYNVDYLEPEANVIRVTGWDSRLDKAFQAYFEDLPSIKPDTIPSARPTNWTGEAYRVSVFDPSIPDLATAAYVAGVLKARLFNGVIVAEIPCEMQLKVDGSPLWRGDVLRVDTVGNWRIKTIEIGHTAEYAGAVGPPVIPAAILRPTTYTCEFIPGSL